MLVSVLMITYNHEDYIRQALESVLNQHGSFEFEVIVANDNSQDRSDLIIKDIILKHPKGNLIKYENHKVNKGMHDNFIWAANQCQGKYVATCEGDDYWTDPYKLQKQIDFLEANPEFEVCFTNIRVVDEHDNITREALITDNRMTEYERKHLPIWAPTLTRVYKNRDFKNLPSAPGMDTAMLLWQSQFGKIKFINDITGAYRKHEGGIYSAITNAKQKQHTLETHLVSLSLIDSPLYSKYVGMVLKKLLEIRFLDAALFKSNKIQVKQVFQVYKNKMSGFLILKIQLSFVLVSLPFINRNKKAQVFLFKIFNNMFIYHLK